MADASRRIDAGLLRLIRTRSGAADAAIVAAYQNSDSFRSLCRDLQACARALSHWEASDSDMSWQRAAEYAQLLGALTEEIRVAISSADRSRTAGGAATPPE